jgi:hypothetical protein
MKAACWWRGTGAYGHVVIDLTGGSIQVVRNAHGSLLSRLPDRMGMGGGVLS